MNDRIKKRKGKGVRKLSWTECLNLLQSLAKEQQCNGERALFDEVAYRLAAEHTDLIVSFSDCVALSAKERKRKVSQPGTSKLFLRVCVYVYLRVLGPFSHLCGPSSENTT